MDQLPSPTVIAEAIVHSVLQEGRTGKDVIKGIQAVQSHLGMGSPDSKELLVVTLKTIAASKTKKKHALAAFKEVQQWAVDSGELSQYRDYSVWRGSLQSLFSLPDLRATLMQQAIRTFPDMVASYAYVQSLPRSQRRLYLAGPTVTSKQIKEQFDAAPTLSRPLVVYRGVALDGPSDITIHNAEPISTSARPELAKIFMSRKACCLLTIHVPIGTPILCLEDPVGTEPGSIMHVEEVVLPPHGKLVPRGTGTLEYDFQYGGIVQRLRSLVEAK